MIYDQLAQLNRYRGLSKALDLAIDFLQSADLSRLPMGRVGIAGEQVYGNHFTYATAPLSQDARFEAHARHLDLHLVLAGREQVALTPIGALTQVEARPEEDAVLYRGAPELTLPMEAGRFLLLYPGEGHLPKLTAGTPAQVDKLVVKLAL